MACFAGAFTFIVAAVAAQAADPPPIEAYGKLPQMTGARMSPGGTMVAAIVSIDGRPALAVHHLDGKPPTVVPSDQYVPDWFQWKSDKRLIVGIHRTARARDLHVIDVETRAIAIDADGSHNIDMGRGRERRFVVKGHRQIEDRVVDILPNDPKHILLGLGGPDGFNAELIDIDTGAGTVFERGKLAIHHWMTDASGAVRLGVGTHDTQQVTFIRDANTSEWREIDRADINLGTPIHPLSFSQDPNVFYAMAVDPAGTWGIYEYDIAKGALTRPVGANVPGEDARPILRDRRLAGYVMPTGKPNVDKAVYFDSAWEHDVESIDRAMPDTLNIIVDRTADAKRVLVFASGPQEPGAYYILDRTGAKPTMEMLADRYPGVDPDQMLPAKPVSYRARDGFLIHGYLILPKGAGAKPIPFIVLPHDGPSARDFGYFDYWAQFLAGRGYGVLQPNFRGSTGYGPKFEQAGLQQWGLAMQNDVTDGTRWLIDQKLADPARICIMGGGYGGYSALMGAATEPDLYRCAISLDGMTDLPDYLYNEHFFSSRFVETPRIDNGHLGDTSPANHADRIKASVLLAHGLMDFHVPADQTQSMESALKHAGKSVEAIYFDDDDGHFLAESDGSVDPVYDTNDFLLPVDADRIAFLKAVEKFIRENLGPGAS